MGEGPKVYSYLRFSDPKQAAGGSADRQREYAAKWAAENGLALDTKLTLFDEGLSAYHQKHVTQGALGVFLRAVQDGLVPIGSTLIVESLDRLSRAEPMVAQTQLGSIIAAGVTVVTASDGRVYSRQRLKDQSMDLVYALLVMIRAHEESETKSKRVKASIRRLCQGWVNGTYRGVIRNGHDPDWVELVDGKFAPIPDRVLALREAVRMYRDGLGHVLIARRLGERGLSFTKSGNMGGTHLYKVLRSRTLIGEKAISVDGESFQLQGYYPAALTVEEFDELQFEVIPRGKRPLREGQYPGVITGQSIAYCGYCGACMTALNNLGRIPRADGGYNAGHLRVICYGNSKAIPCPVLGSCSVIPIERAILSYCSDQMNLSRLAQPGGGGAELASSLALVRGSIRELQGRVDRLTEAFAEVGTSAALVKKLRDAEAELATRKDAEAALEFELGRQVGAVTETTSGQWRKVAAGVLKLNPEARLQARQLIADTFRRIVIYHRGIAPEPERVRQSVSDRRGRRGVITVTLVSKSGVQRTLSVDRQTGEWLEMYDASDVPPQSAVAAAAAVLLAPASATDTEWAVRVAAYEKSAGSKGSGAPKVRRRKPRAPA